MSLADDRIKFIDSIQHKEQQKRQREEFQDYITSQLEYYKDYFVAVLFGESTEDGTPIDSDYDIYDIDRQSLIKQFTELDEFFKQAGDILEKTDYTHEQACHDFYFTRVGHGVGFWENDHCEETEGNQLTEIAKKFGEIHCYIENDKVFID